MRIFCGLVALLTALASSAFAQPVAFHEPVPLTNTRYGTASAVPELATNGRDVILLWRTGPDVRVTSYTPGSRRIGQVVFDSAREVAAASTGANFLAAAMVGNTLSTRMISRSGEPLGVALPVAQGSEIGRIRLAANGSSAMLLYANSGVATALPLDANGKPTGEPKVLSASSEPHLHDLAITAHGDGFAVALSTTRDITFVSLDRTGREQSRSILSSDSAATFFRPVSIASNGNAALVVWRQADGSLTATLAGAQVSTPIALGEPNSTVVSVLPIGDGWAVAYVVGNVPPRPLRIAWLDRELKLVRTEDVRSGFDFSVAKVNGQPFVAWRDSPLPGFVSWAPLGGTPEIATYEAARQAVAAAVSSADATLVVWHELLNRQTSLRAGLLSRDRWSETELAAAIQPDSFTTTTRAATDGHEFVVVSSNAPKAIFIGSNGARRLDVPLPIRPQDITWNGAEYLILGEDEAGVAAIRLSTSGAVSPAVHYGSGIVPRAIASNGTTTMIAWIEPYGCPFECIGIQGPVTVVRIAADLQPVDATTLLQAVVVDDFRLVADGTRFRAAWLEYEAVSVATIDARTGAVTARETLPARAPSVLDVAMRNGSLAVSWVQIDATLRGNENVVVMLDSQNNVTGSASFGVPGTYAAGAGRVAFLPNGNLAHFAAERIEAAPYYGSARVMMRVSGFTGPVPDAPRLEVLTDRDRIHLLWTALPQLVRGYRVEFRLNEGPWEEIERTFAPNEISMQFDQPLVAGARYEFRVRAFNDAGVGAYSPSVGLTVAGPKRRAVR
ncbi:MAG: fibronectin type III domain-containing protein [Acidobacteriota bacterium]|nr:fibronectin type III domain-containing protein [Acidobacteriota bacterium]